MQQVPVSKARHFSTPFVFFHTHHTSFLFPFISSASTAQISSASTAQIQSINIDLAHYPILQQHPTTTTGQNNKERSIIKQYLPLQPLPYIYCRIFPPFGLSRGKGINTTIQQYPKQQIQHQSTPFFKKWGWAPTLVVKLSNNR